MTQSATPRAAEGVAPIRPARYRYGAVLVLTLVLLVFEIVAPARAWARALALALEGAALLVVVATSRDRSSVRRARSWLVATAGLALVVAVGADLLPDAVTFACGGLLAAAVAGALVVGAVRLARERGVTLEAVAAGVAIYLLVGLLFAWVIRLAAAVSATPYFAGHQATGGGAAVYFSFTVLTTTGFGDYVAATSGGRAIAVVEMLLGQLYLVTVIGVLVGAVAGARRA
jgi:hypothetical protein